MYQVRADRTKNCLFLVLQGFLTDAELEKAADETIAASGTLKAPFVVVNDISTFKPASEVGSNHIQRAQGHMVKNNLISRVIRVIEAPMAGMQFNRTARQAGATYDVTIVRTMADAEALL